jgi:pyridoxal 5'-phosphate synthase pdxT subunit
VVAGEVGAGRKVDREAGANAVSEVRVDAHAEVEAGVLVGVLALQGDFAAHSLALSIAGARVRPVRVPDDLVGVRGLVIPGGESTALLRLMAPVGMGEALRAFHREGGVLFGTCAGLILLATKVTGPEQPSLGLLDLVVERNGYGRQVDSFVSTGRLGLPGEPEQDLEMVFIRAPRIRAVGPDVRVIGTHAGEPVLVEQNRIIAATFHPEMSAQPTGGGPVHRRFLMLCRAVRP